MATKTKDKTRKIYVRDLATREVVGEVVFTGKSATAAERTVMGMLINMDTDRYFVDDSECDDLP